MKKILKKEVPPSPGQGFYDFPQERNINLVPSISIKVFSVIKFLVLSTIVLLVLNVLVVLSYELGFAFPGRSNFYFDQEGNLPSYFSSFILLLSSLLLGIIAAIKRKEDDAFALHWIILAVLFFALSIDESAGFHEELIEPLGKAFHATGYLRFAWVIAGVPFVIIFCYFYFKFFMSLSKTMKILFFISGATYVLGVLGFEMIGSNLYVNTRDRNLPYMIVMTIEETLEMVGIVLFIYTLMLYIKSYFPKIKLFVE